jgi:L-seryl-tRNA(Ser) seleniumtransferase
MKGRIMNPDAKVKADPRASIPSVDSLLRKLERHGEAVLPRWARLEGARRVLAEARAGVAAGNDAPSHDVLMQRVEAEARELARPHPTVVVNATGIVLHTNLGRAPLPPEAADAAARVGRTYGDLELDLQSGTRGNRTGWVADKLRQLSGAAGAVVVNNNAGAMLLALAALAKDREVVVSRGELVEIGGSFRIPDILEAGGTRLREVGTTNRTHIADYERAVGPQTGLLLKVHRSNFEQRGFVKEVSLQELAALSRRCGVPVVEDLGSGALVDLSARGFPAEIFAPARLRAGADVVCFSGDKLLGGPQAGILLCRDAGTADNLRSHPLARALRLDKLSLAALDWTLGSYLSGRAEQEIPVLRQLLVEPGELEVRARALAADLESALPRDVVVEVQPDRAYAGGGSLPGFELATFVVALRTPMGAARLASRLRAASPPVLVRIRDENVILDTRTLLFGDEKTVARVLAQVLR